MSPGDRLLYAISAKREMSWPVFKRTFDLLCMQDLAERSLENMKFVRYETARTLDSLGHIEADFDWPNARLYAAPPTLSLLPGSGLPVAVLSGARAPNTLDLLSEIIKKRSGGVELAVRNQRDESKRFPERVAVVGESRDDLASVAQEVGFTFQRVPPSWAILNFAGSLSEYLSRCQWSRTDELNWESRQFSVESLRFSAPQSNDDLRLVRYTHPSRQYPIHYLWRGNDAARVDPDWGRFAALKGKGRNVVHYDRPSCAVAIPTTVALPKLLSRALCFCSGLIPWTVPAAAVTGPRFRVYPNVPSEFALLLAMKLDQILITDFTLLDTKK